MNEASMAAALRKIATGLADLASALEDSHGDDEDDRKAAALARFDVPPENGLTRPQASAVLREHRLAPQYSGVWSNSGLIAYDPENDRRWLTDEGRAWLRAHAQAAALDPLPDERDVTAELLA
jgi:hypothetical protein